LQYKASGTAAIMTVLRRNTVLYALSWAEVRGENTELDLFVGRYKVSRATSSYVDVIINILENKTLFELAVFSYCVQIVGAGAAATGLSWWIASSLQIHRSLVQSVAPQYVVAS
jgi:hypothetical protein